MNTAPPAVTRAIGRVLRPLVRLLLDYGVTLPTALDMLKTIYVGIAQDELRRAGREINDSRISVLTGVHRKDVRRLRGSSGADMPAPASVSIGAQIVAQWLARPDLLDSRKRPLPLHRLRRGGGARSFEALAESVSRDVGPRAVLEDLLRLGVASVDENDRVRLNAAAFIPKHGLEEKAYYLGKNVHDHLAAAVQNLRGEEPPQLERSVHYVALSKASVERLARTAERLGTSALHKLNREAHRLKQGDGKVRADGHRMTFGVYFHREPDDRTGEVPPKSGRGRK